MFYLRKQHKYRQEEGGEGEGNGGGDEPKVEGNEPNPNAEVEDKARKMGWTPKDEFKGDPDKWRDAAEFVERGENMVPLLRSQVKRQEREMAELKRTIAELADHNTKVSQKAYERAFRDLKAQQVEAVASGDSKAFVEIDGRIEELRKEAASVVLPKVQEDNPDNDPDYQAFVAENKWMEDPELEAEATAQAAYLRARGNKLVGAPFLDAVKKRVKEARPDKFNNPRRNAAPSVEGGNPPAKKGGKTYADLPADAKAACDRFVKNSGGKMTRESYTKQYFEEE